MLAVRVLLSVLTEIKRSFSALARVLLFSRVVRMASSSATLAALRYGDQQDMLQRKKEFYRKYRAWLRAQCESCFAKIGDDTRELLLAFVSARWQDLWVVAAVNRTMAHAVHCGRWGQSSQAAYEHAYLTAMKVSREMEAEAFESELAWRAGLEHFQSLGFDSDDSF